LNPLQLPNPDDDPTFETELRAVYRWICSASMFIDQRIAASTSASVGKHVAQRAAKLGVPSQCQVVQMRRLDRRCDEGGGERDASMEWQFQWLVRGHWRQQFHPKAGRHVPRWIAPYMKGPHDKPKKTPKPMVFSVRR